MTFHRTALIAFKSRIPLAYCLRRSTAERTVRLCTARATSYTSKSTAAFATAERGKKHKSSASCIGATTEPVMPPGLIEELDDQQHGRAIELTNTESTLRSLLLDVADHVQQKPGKNVQPTLQAPKDQAIVLRFTGGWVRDKLLGVPSHDVDVAINSMTGEQFGLHMKAYLEIPGNAEKYGLEGVATTDKQDQKAGSSDKSKVVGGLHKIAANPEKSKHLETVTTRIFGLDIDLVNLRKETYSDDSRNPQMMFGTPEEDALRRDATVNAMFYNLNTEQVEDFTGQGHEDMHKKILRTPLEPYQTFKDDPLRVLRLIRFASRLRWTIDQSTLQAMRHPDIKEALRKKISRERVGIELEKALRGPDPHQALHLIFDLGLYDTIFCDPLIGNGAHEQPDLAHFEAVIDGLEQILSNAGSISTIAARDADEQYLAWTLASLIPYRDATQQEPAQLGRKAPPPLAAQVAREGIKTTSKTCDLVTACVRNLSDIQSVIDGFYQQSKRPLDRAATQDFSARDFLGMKLRAWGPTWRTQVIFALLGDIALEASQSQAYQRKYSTFLEHLRTLDILDAYQLKPMLDGKQLAKALNTPPGPWMKDALEVIIAWQLRNPHSTNPEEAVEVLKHGELVFSLAQHFLKLTIRPLFIKTKPSKVTEHGRRQMTAAVAESNTFDDETYRPWKSAVHAPALDLLRWSIESLNNDSVQQLWPLLMPPILTLIDDWQIRYRTLGVELLTKVLEQTPNQLLARTGLGPVFEEALMPCLTYLPPLTHQDESLSLLPAVYAALSQLAHRRFPEPAEKEKVEFIRAERAAALDSIMRKGVLYGYTHASQHPVIVSMLMHQLASLLHDLGIESVKHLKFVLPMLTEVLSYALPEDDLHCLQSTIVAMQALIINAWPRIPEYRGEVLKGLTLCWLNLASQSTPAQQNLGRGLRYCLSLLKAAIGNQVDLDAEFIALCDADPQLAGLFAS